MPGRKQDNCYYNDDYLEADGKQVGFFQLSPQWSPVPGRMLIVGFEFEKHAYHDATTTVAEVEGMVIWSRRITRGYTSEPFEHSMGFGIRIDRVAPIVEEK